ncbi:hypothetical protein RND81_05G075900 [Saponaria officinalis]|uniref:pectinesterase n=1 Tax=Saponaria officinalis TaxID=3572 RepID=A0AAW1KVG0_SAPOF
MTTRFLPNYFYDIFMFLLLIPSSTINMVEGIRDNTDFIRVSCKTTEYPTLCYSTLSKYATTIKTSPSLLTKTALLVTHDAAQNASSFMSNYLDDKKTSPTDDGPMKDCKELLGDAIEELTKSIVEMDKIKDYKNFQFHMSNVETWVSAALTDASTCIDGFEGKNVKTMVKKVMDDLEERTSNALCIVNSYASHY